MLFYIVSSNVIHVFFGLVFAVFSLFSEDIQFPLLLQGYNFIFSRNYPPTPARTQLSKSIFKAIQGEQTSLEDAIQRLL